MLTNRDSQCRALADLGKVIASAFAFEMKQAYMDVVMKDRDAWNFHERAAKGADSPPARRPRPQGKNLPLKNRRAPAEKRARRLRFPFR